MRRGHHDDHESCLESSLMNAPISNICVIPREPSGPNDAKKRLRHDYAIALRNARTTESPFGCGSAQDKQHNFFSNVTFIHFASNVFDTPRKTYVTELDFCQI